MKPVLYVANCSEDQLTAPTKLQIKQNYKITNKNQPEFIYISAKIESELNELSDDEKREYLDELGISDSGVNQLIKAAYSALNLITYFTSGEKESRAWTIRKGTKAPQAAGKIHSDMERGFIALDVIGYQDLLDSVTYAKAREKGLLRTEGKNYVVQDGDIIHFRFNI